MTREERLEWLKQIEKDIFVCSLESTFADDAKSCAIHSIIEELEQEPCNDCVSREAVFDWLCEGCERYHWNGDNVCLTKCEDYRTIAKLPFVQPTSSWIPVTERLPENEGAYLVTTRDLFGGKLTASNVFECIYIADDWIYHGWEDNKVLAWMPKPEPYKENKE